MSKKKTKKREDSENYEVTRNEVRKRLWDWMIKANGDEKWCLLRADCIKRLHDAILVIKGKSFDHKAKYSDIPLELRLEATSLMIYKEDIENMML